MRAIFELEHLQESDHLRDLWVDVGEVQAYQNMA